MLNVKMVSLLVWCGMVSPFISAVSGVINLGTLDDFILHYKQNLLIGRSTDEMEGDRSSLGRDKRELTADCGEIKPSVRLRRVARDVSSIENAPWLGALYVKRNGEFRFTGGATLIDDDKVITDVSTIMQENPQNIKIIFGNSLIHDVLQGTEEPVFEVSKTVTHPFYSKANFYMNNIVLLVLKTKVRRSANVTPVCIDLQNKSAPLQKDQLLQVASFNKEELSSNGPNLHLNTVTFIDRESCRSYITKSFEPFLAKDKFCIYYNGSTLLTFGAGGSGVTRQDNGTNRHYLEGIISLKPKDIENIFATINIREHFEWIQQSL